ncbi:MAG TPA: diacylglycerol kinase family protein [Victivallales bacterium]|nr:diacylglycerol kinase family protein [Victivallales bacterium]
MSEIIKFFKSFKFAFAGIFEAFKSEKNVKFHYFAALCVLILSFILKLSITQWCIIIMTICLVISVEMINTSIEKLCNVVCKDSNEFIKKVKDISAGSVLVVSIAACIVGILIFGSRILDYLY